MKRARSLWNLRVDTERAYGVAHAVGNDAEELREELQGLQRDWDNVSRGWSGAAASAYSSIWVEWFEGATKLVDSLAESSHGLGVAAIRYTEQDADSAVSLEGPTMDLGL